MSQICFRTEYPVWLFHGKRSREMKSTLTLRLLTIVRKLARFLPGQDLSAVSTISIPTVFIAASNHFCIVFKKMTLVVVPFLTNGHRSFQKVCFPTIFLLFHFSKTSNFNSSLPEQRFRSV